ncbi:MAG TPA: STAS domain-containing protein [Terriglobales bacterium]|jgi:anti-anti-sigma regulatory factor|nr:STAS domain-containing protein [Terriglobales bacterium]
MLRITELPENDMALRFRLDGTIAAESYLELAELISRQRKIAGRTVIIDMAGVEFISERPARELAQLRGEHLRIINCSPFITTLLDTLGSLKTNNENEI